jgi:hypothetical protein
VAQDVALQQVLQLEHILSQLQLVACIPNKASEMLV